jgi:hypothetical protein
MRLGTSLVLLAAALILAGCGGGSSGSNAIPTDTSFAFGDLVGRAAISNPPKTTSSSDVVATAFTGTFSSLKLRELNPNLDETRIVFATHYFGTFYNLATCAPDGSDLQRLTTSLAAEDDAPTFSGVGKVAFQSDRAGGLKSFLVNTDGSGTIQLTTTNALYPQIDAAATKILFANGTLQVMNIATKATTIPSVDPATLPIASALSSDGRTVYYLGVDNTPDYTLYRTPADGTGSWYGFAAGDDAVDMAVSPDGSEVAYMTGSPSVSLVRVGTGDGAKVGLPVPGIGGAGLSYSPDGKKIVFSTNSADFRGKVYVLDIASHFITPISPELTSSHYPSWSGFTKERTLISSGGGLLGLRACGVIYGQSGKSTRSVVAFDVTTPSSVVMTAQTPANSTSPNLVFSADADSIIKLAYANGSGWRGIRAIGSGTPVVTANGALISIDASDGSVVSVLPFNGTRGVDSKPTIRDEGSTRIFSGQFLAVYDKDGKNLAPSGASQVRLDTKTNVITVG